MLRAQSIGPHRDRLLPNSNVPVTLRPPGEISSPFSLFTPVKSVFIRSSVVKSFLVAALPRWALRVLCGELLPLFALLLAAKPLSSSSALQYPNMPSSPGLFLPFGCHRFFSLYPCNPCHQRFKSGLAQRAFRTFVRIRGFSLRFQVAHSTTPRSLLVSPGNSW